MLFISNTIAAGLPPSKAEASAIHLGMKLAAEAGLLPAIVESDSLSVIGLVIEDILELKAHYGFSSFVLSPRTSNRVAHSPAKMAIVHAIDVVLLEEVPHGIKLLVQKEAIFS
ncbi:hypothetical protein ACOSQ3_027035 [Xanthoceras sorbifolium]